MAKRGQWLTGGVVLSVIYACSGTPDVTSPNSPNSVAGGSAGSGASGSGTGGSSHGGSANNGTGGTINLTGGTGTGAKGGKGGKGGSSGAAQGGESEGGFGNDFSAAGLPDITFTYDPPMGGQGGACASETGVATLRKR